MELLGTPPPRSQSQRTSSPPSSARDPRRHLLRGPKRLRLETLAPRLPTVEDCLPLLPFLAFGRNVGEDARCPTQTSAGAHKEKPPAQRGDSRQPVDQDNRRRRRA